MRFLFFLVAIGLVLLIAIPAMIALAFTAVSVFGAMLPWLAVGLFAWFLIGTGRERRRDRWSRNDWSSQRNWNQRTWNPSAPRPTPPAPRAPVQPRPAAKAELPIEVEVKVEQIRRKVEVLLGYAERFPVFSQDLYLVRQTASEYLPRTINAFQALAATGGAEAATTSGKTAIQELHEQLDLLDHKLDEIAGNLQHRDLDRLLANRRFLEERFGQRIA